MPIGSALWVNRATFPRQPLRFEARVHFVSSGLTLTKTESYSKRNSRASSIIHLLVSSQQALRVIHFPSVLQLPPECFRTPDTNLIPSRIDTKFRRIVTDFDSFEKTYV